MTAVSQMTMDVYQLQVSLPQSRPLFLEYHYAELVLTRVSRRAAYVFKSLVFFVVFLSFFVF